MGHGCFKSVDLDEETEERLNRNETHKHLNDYESNEQLQSLMTNLTSQREVVYPQANSQRSQQVDQILKGQQVIDLSDYNFINKRKSNDKQAALVQDPLQLI